MTSAMTSAMTRALALVPIRDGELPAGADETIAECGGRALVVGTGASRLVGATNLGAEVRVAEFGPFAPAAYAAALAPVLGDERVVVLPASPDGRDLAPRLAHALDRRLVAGAVEVSAGRVVAVRSGGRELHTWPVHQPIVATFQPGVRGVAPVVDGRPAVEVTIPPVEVATSDATVVAIHPPDASTMDLTEARRILGGGAGLDSAERFEQLSRVAAALEASMGATRVITDRSWVPHQRQIGTTGVVVTPELYVAFGISGAVQHTSGLGDPAHVISVNVDPHCPMMQLADLAIVADANAVLDELERLVGAQSDV
jgi:electron transfer flavoprotein alpha subunit